MASPRAESCPWAGPIQEQPAANRSRRACLRDTPATDELRVVTTPAQDRKPLNCESQPSSKLRVLKTFPIPYPFSHLTGRMSTFFRDRVRFPDDPPSAQNLSLQNRSKLLKYKA